MPKGIHDERYRRLISALVDARKTAGVSQAELAARVAKPQQFVSRYELGERRLDIIEFLDVSKALGFDALDALAKMA